MKQFSTIADTKTSLEAAIREGKQIGFIPTMGALHEGHLMLIRRAKQENDLVVSSVFVNPTQFNNKEDLEKYPRNLTSDAKMLEENGCDLLFAPDVLEMYPAGENDLLNIDFGPLGKVMEGKFRPGHFQGVATIVHRLFDVVEPNRAYFGKKDYQQLAVICTMVNKMNLPVEIVGCETVRETDGLAMSSRNLRLTPPERAIAPKIYAVLKNVKQMAGSMPVRELQQWAVDQIAQNPEFKLEYFEIGDKNSLMPLENWNYKEDSVAFIAVFLGAVRLIDNLELFS
jgi:pantoate--beta-alanine ligase